MRTSINDILILLQIHVLCMNELIKINNHMFFILSALVAFFMTSHIVFVKNK